ncbi:MAG: N-acetyl-gamma-glutamyl-phosphate reductase [Rhizobiales bacterium]|nr:N-acetyl-gamma-glutamyl-phosphate reductase [Hyphomicrobiales bacterium]MBO6698265.1 N-acetyl-gamma-glutamyl-phosphate reductase [Hyphomicrobiales bacterium]MBO6735481.1 N-acetyl-gamma-glutamyl-phosphate reductase [Hyphomicrobiales bacterium]MBO6910711.1 N-acetyl-gamma-glutamyl-phosphate reductase [Hyphomicrobiales bacterium]MBO6956928.1 N-acetyl-gamma-glutamyl-phosphate reductase [Hyphomicrobiales bacterium]
MTKTIKTAILGASGYTGADAMRLALRHPNIEIVALTANTHAGKPVGDVFEHLRGVDLPDLVTLDDVDWKGVDLVICALPHGTTQATTKTIRATNPDCVVVDMSADFRLRDTDTYAQWYGIPHGAPELQGEAAYGLSEHNRDAIAGAKIVACPGCFPTAALTALIPPLADGHIQADDIVIDAKTGISGAGRGLKQGMLFAEAGEGTSPYGIGHHRHMPEIEQELSKASSQAITIGFTPHLVPMSRGELLTCHVRLANNVSVDDVRAGLAARYADEPFVLVLDEGQIPKTQNVRGSNMVHIGVFKDRLPGRAIIIAALDNLVKGSAGQALQNVNIAFGFEETLGLEQVALFP